jgi:hypothetical protein
VKKDRASKKASISALQEEEHNVEGPCPEFAGQRRVEKAHTITLKGVATVCLTLPNLISTHESCDIVSSAISEGRKSNRKYRKKAGMNNYASG